MNLLDPIGACFSLSSTFFFTQAKRFAWILGLAAIIINTILYYQKGIYGRLGLEFIYFASMIYGFTKWSEKSNSKIRPITFLSTNKFLLLITGGIIVSTVFGLSLKHYTNSTIPFMDASSCVFSLIAQLLLCLKIIQCWWIWFFVDIQVGVLQLQKGIPFHSLVHFIYIGLAVTGYYKWQQLYNNY